MKIFTGTAKQLTAQSITLNGEYIEQVAICMLARYGLIKAVGIQKRAEGVRGKDSKIYELASKEGFVFDSIE